ncbi:hypothetical protein [Exiguobacterium sp. BG5(2022)]|uniref:hypothetical protein n=1 Tax=Exiguobacterium sp. BG5(2022) TaxID=2962595 RepID=UPI0028812CC5|nr:hypothetical protein [Exiguobacterium sp. BG5(2022)]MDT0193719.1 hypothetical protein [Exiguobacterium sp. BG5(2022)]
MVMETSNFSNLTKAEYEVKEALSNLKDAKLALEQEYVDATKAIILNTLKDGNELTDQMLDMILVSLSRQVKNLYEDK